jgi:hypothetical protein
MERYIKVLSGTWWVGTGPKYDPDSTYPMPAGSYVVDRANELHYDGAKDADCVIYLIGMGPVSTTAAGAK